MKYIYSLATGGVSLLNKRSRQAAEFMKKQEGFYGVHPNDETGNLLWFYDSLNHAKIARNKGSAKGIQFGYNICRFKLDENNIPCYDRVEC